MTCREAVPVLPPSVPVTVCAPDAEAVQIDPLQDPFGEIEKTVLEVTSPSELSYLSRPCAVYVCDPPEEIEADAGESARWSREPAVTLSDAVAVFPESFPVTVCAPAAVAVHTLALQEPFGPIENTVEAVTSPSERLDESKPCAV